MSNKLQDLKLKNKHKYKKLIHQKELHHIWYKYSSKIKKIK